MPRPGKLWACPPARCGPGSTGPGPLFTRRCEVSTMSEFRPFLDREARQVHGDPGALDAVLRRAERRRTMHRAAAGAVALAIAGGSLGLAYAAFRPDREVRPIGPVPGPTPSVVPSPHAIAGLLISNGSSTEAAAEFAVAILGAKGVAPDVV